MSTQHTDQEIAEATETLLMAILTSFGDEADDQVIPLRQFIVDLGKLCRVELLTGQMLELPEEMTVGELRARLRMARGRLASEEWRP